ncbi:MAG: carboxypeptidase-like regulatory domain-containing protein [Planctomycetota bacterium]
MTGEDGAPHAAALYAKEREVPDGPVETAHAGEDGRFALTLQPGDWHLHAEAEGLISDPEWFELDPGQARTVDLVLRPSAMVWGFVQDPAGARTHDVLVYAHDSWDDLSSWTRTDKEGRYALHVPAGRIVVTADRAEFGPSSVAATIEAGQRLQIDLRLTSALSISGCVTDRGGRPVADAEVEADWRGDDDWDYPDPRTAITDASGAYVLTRLKPGPHRVTAFAKGLRAPPRTDVLAGSDRIDFVLLRGGAIEGKVVRRSDGSPLRSADVTAWAMEQGWGLGTRGEPLGEDGAFRIEGLLPRTYLLHAWAPGLAPAARDVEVRDEETTGVVVLEVRDGGSIEGTVLSASTGAPVGDADVGVKLGVGSMGSHTDASGHFHLEGVEPGMRPLSVGHPEYVGLHTTLEVTESSVVTQTFRLDAGARLEGRVLGRGGRPIRRERVLVVPSGDGVALTTDTDEEGRFKLASLRPGPCLLYCLRSQPGQTTIASAGVDLRAGSTSEVVLTLSTGGRLTGSVRRAGRGVPDVVLSFSSTPRPGVSFRATTDRLGTYGVDGLPSGVYVVETDGLREEVSVGAGDTRRDFDLPDGQ